ncbi:MAG: hypothetical protein ACKVOP_04105 [Sphingomonadaceae bacterium]
MRALIVGGCVAGLAGLSWVAATAQTQVVRPPKARYAMDVGTTKGMAAMGSGIGGGMSMMFGGGNSNRIARELILRLGSVEAAKGTPKADHFVPAGMKMGKSLPLIAPDRPRDMSGMPEQFKPEGRVLIFWGCGERAPKGQPIVIDLAKVAAGARMAMVMTSTVSADPGPQSSTSRAFVDYPNRQSDKVPSREGSLLGAHRITSTLAPEIGFTLQQDYMPGLNVRSTTMPSGAVALNWSGIAGATGYYAYSFGGKMGEDGKMRDMVLWSSASAREFGGGLMDWLSPATVARLVTQKIVMPPSQTNCAIPAEVKTASAGFMFGTMNAYGPESNFAFPPRPSDPKIAWAPDWTARVRFRSTTSWMSGVPGMGDMSGGDSSRGGQGDDGEPRRKCGMIQRAAGLC